MQPHTIKIQVKVIPLISMTIDDREQQLIQFLSANYPDLAFQVKRLDLGDIHITVRHGGTLIIERKTITDYANSIRDGRLKEQCGRLQQLSGHHTAIYLVEGTIDQCLPGLQYQKVSPKALYSSFASKILRDQVPLIRTDNLAHSALLLERLYTRAPDLLTASLKSQQSDTIIVSTKKKAPTPQQCFKNQLLQIPGVSDKTAQVLMTRYPNWRALLQAQPQELAQITMESGRRLGSSKAQQICRYINC